MLPFATATLAASLLLQLPAAVYAKLSLPAIFSDGMVLQDHATYDQRPFIYGYSDVLLEEVTVVRTLPDGKNDTFLATADNSTGFWIVQCDPDYFSADQNNCTFSIWGASNPADLIVIRNAAYGDVFLCSGQSNMDENVASCFDANETMGNTYPNLRLFSVVKGGSEAPQRDLPPFVNHSVSRCYFPQSVPIEDNEQLCNAWQAATRPSIIGTFSAACFYTATALAQQLTGNRVLGMIHSSVSGTAMKDWAPPEALASCNAATTTADASALAAADSPAAAAAAAASPASFPAATAAAIPPGLNCSLWNAMISPISRYAIRGVIWDQGESDGGETAAYFGCLFQALIEAWRRHWRIGDYAWVYAQLGAQDADRWPAYWTLNGRAGQAAAQPGAGTTDTTGMAVAYDIGDMGSPYPPAHVHSRRKTELGRRLAIILQHVQYAIQWPAGGNITLQGEINWSPPVPAAAARDAAGGAVTLTFSTLDGAPLALNGTADCWECCAAARDSFQVGPAVDAPAGWVNCSVAQTGNLTLVLTPVEAGAPLAAVRYAPNLWPQCAVYSTSNGLPTQPFAIVVANATTVTADVPVVEAEAAAAAAPFPAASPLVPVAVRGPHTWTHWRGRPVPPPAAPGAFMATPPMGFNSWNAYHCNVNDNMLRKTGDALVKTGLAALGYIYVNSDDCWQVDRFPNGTIIADPTRFPAGFRATATYLHSIGVKAGLYTAQRQYTCQMRPGSYTFEDVDIDTYCAWGMDYVKTDGCGGAGWPQDNVTWIKFRAGIDRCVAGGGAPIALSVESCNDPSPAGCSAWIGKLANTWRTTGDIQGTFASVLGNLDSNNGMAAFAGPGHWNDADMLQVGNAGLSPDEARSHFAAWCLIASPLLIGADVVSGLDADSLAILSSAEVIAVSQDPLGVQGVRVSAANATGTECWARPLADGSVAALLLNRGLTPATAACSWAQLGLKDPAGRAAVRDLYARADLGSFAGGFATPAPLALHASMIVKVTPAAVQAAAAAAASA